MYYLGLDIGSSSVKVALVEASTGKNILCVNEPPNEMEIQSLQVNWAEQDPETWWHFTCKAIKRVLSETRIDVPIMKLRITSKIEFDIMFIIE